MKTCAKRSKMNDFTPLTLTREFHEDEAPLAIVDSHNNPTSSLGNGERLLTKCSPAKLLKLVKNLTPEQRAAVRKIGFGGLLNLRCSSLRRNLCWWLVQQFDEETSTIDIGGTSVPILEREMEYILGLRCDGKEVKVVDNKRIYGLTAHLREKYGAVGNKISVQVLVERLSSKEAGEDFVRDFILYVLAIFLCPPTNLRANAYYLLPLLNMDHVSQLSWGKHVHKFLIRSLVKAKRLHKHAVSGCLFFLQIWYYEHTNVGYPHQLNAIYPRIKLWGETEIKDRDALENAVDDFGSTKVCPPIWDTISGSSWPDKAGRKGQDADASGNSPSKELNKESLEEVVSHGSPHWEEFKRKACSKDTVGISELHEEIKALRQIVLEMQSAMTTQATSYELQLHSLLLEVQAQTLKQQSQNALLTELFAEVQSLKRSKTKCQHVCESQPAIVAKICGEGLSAQGPPEVQPPTIAISTMTSVGQLEPYNLSSDDSAASDMEEDDGAGNMMTRNKSIVLRSVKDVLSEDAVIRRAEMYQEYMKHIPIPSQRGTLIPFRTWQGLAKSIKQLYGQPLHYLTNILLKKWDEARIGTEDEYQPLDATIHPLKAEATIWLMEEVHRRTSSHHHLAELWASDSMHHSFVDPIFPQL